MTTKEIKEKMLGFTQLFSEESNIFQRFVFVYQYVEFLNEHASIRDILQKIFDETVKLTYELEGGGLEDNQIHRRGHSIFTHEFTLYYTKLEVIHGEMKRLQEDHSRDKGDLDKLSQHFSKPYSPHLLELSFKVVNSEVFDRLDKLHFLEAGPHLGKTYFDETKSILYIQGRKIHINIQDTVTNAHKLLRHFFISNKNNLGDDFYYVEIAEDEFSELDYKNRKNNWRKYHYACEDINRKVERQTNNDIKDFLVFNTGIKGRVKINAKYL